MKYPRLGVNIDHVATLRKQRGESYPEVERAALVALASGAHQITIHLREDRRHIEDRDVPAVHKVCKEFELPLNFEMGCSDEMVRIASNEKPAWVCLVPEKREERTTEGGLDIISAANFEKVKKACEQIKAASPTTKISLFVEADKEVLERCTTLKIDAVEIHTGEFAKDFINLKDYSELLSKFKEGSKIIKSKGLGYHAGHGLTIDSLVPLLEQAEFEEYNIGHWIIAESVFLGMGHVIKEMLELMKKHPLKG